MLLKILLLTDEQPFPLMGTLVSPYGNARFLLWELSFLLLETGFANGLACIE